MAAVLSSRDTQSVRSAWRGFNAGTWTTRVDVRDFIQKNYTPYEGDERFLASATERTRTLWQKLLPFRRCRELLSVMLGVQPTAQTQAVYRSLKENPVERTTPDQIKVEQGRARTEKMEDPASVSA
jgi:pyruvate-formate lyase